MARERDVCYTENHESHNMTSKWVPISSAVFLVLLACHPPGMKAQGVPDIVWKTNAHVMPVTSLAISPDGSLVGSGSLEDGFFGYVRVWSVGDIALLKDFELSHEDVFSVAFSPDGNYFAEGGGGGS